MEDRIKSLEEQVGYLTNKVAILTNRLAEVISQRGMGLKASKIIKDIEEEVQSLSKRH